MLKKVGLVALVVIAVGAFLTKDKWSVLLYLSATTKNEQSLDYFISKPMDVQQLAEDLKSKGVVNSKSAFVALGKYKHLTKERIAVGYYKIEKNTSIRNLLNGFTLNSNGNGNAELEMDIVVPNVRFVSDIAGKLSRNLILDSAEFMSIVSDEQFLKDNKLSYESMPAIFVPNTYKMFYDTDAKVFINRMLTEYRAFWSEERLAKLKIVGLKTPEEAVTLASIVYSEQSKNQEEWPTVAGLYLNRIRQGIPLQSDPTFKFCWGKELDTVQRLLAIHRDIDCNYNTYKIQGLPPGPICIPPHGVVNAVLNPEKHNYVFMVALPSYSGKHFFSSNYSEHQRNAVIFQRWLSKELANNN